MMFQENQKNQTVKGGERVKKAIITASLMILVMASSGYAARNSAVIATGPHDMSAGSALNNADATINGQTCVFCHTPHGGSTTVPLWNRNNPTSTYQLYTSSTLDSTTTSATIQSSVSGACLSCHDGSIAIDVLRNLNGVAFTAGVAFTVQGTATATYGNSGSGTNNILAGGIPYLGTDLRNDHPVSMIYETARAATAAEFVTQTANGSKIYVASASGDLPLYGTSTATATVECASCHNPHNNSQGTFLRKSNAASAVCLTCHIK